MFLKGNKILVFILLLTCATILHAQTSTYINKYRPLSDSLSMVYHIPSAVILGVAIVESSSGASRNCRLLNNHFGIVGKNNLYKTRKIKTRYKQYPDATASYIDFCRLITRRSLYRRLKNNPNAYHWIDAISKSNYSELPDIWKKRVSSVIKKYKL